MQFHEGMSTHNSDATLREQSGELSESGTAVDNMPPIELSGSTGSMRVSVAQQPPMIGTSRLQHSRRLFERREIILLRFMLALCSNNARIAA